MNSTVIKYGIGAIVLSAIIAGVIWFKKQSELLTNTCIKLGKIKPLNINWNETVLEIPILLKNLSNINLTIVKQKYEVFLDDKKVAEIEGNQELILVPNVQQSISFNAVFSPKQIIKGSLGDFVFAFNTMKLRVKINTTFKLGFINTTIKYTYEDSVVNLVSNISKPKEGSKNPLCD